MDFPAQQKVVEYFLTKGYQIDTDVLNYLCTTNSNIDGFANFIEQKYPRATTIGQNQLDSFLTQTTDSIIVFKEPTAVQKPYSVDTFLTHLQKRYDFIKSLLERRLELTNLTSIGKIGNSKHFSVIAFIREVDYENNTMMADDKTGSVIIIFKESSKLEFLFTGEVVGIVCEKKGDNIIAQNIVVPDVPIKKTITKTNKTIKCMFLSSFNSDDVVQQFCGKYEKWLESFGSGEKYIFVLGGISKDDSKAKEILKTVPQNCRKILIGSYDKTQYEDCSILQEPTLVRLSNISILLMSGAFLKKYETRITNPENLIINLIKKRYLDPTYDSNHIFYENDPYLLGEIPDLIVISDMKESKSFNYKGITTLLLEDAPPKPVFWAVDLETRETIKVDFP